ncbi:TetR/AcrR family transcriptional regulator [Arthrobacter sp. zg-Y820]|uniref:TetR/AcrR family transcriptional regulator n=1 Tax=unclassified Arthrobacter TaxID=235627 RepID=UPI001E3EA472|nr:MULTISPECIES: TetR/AcrR family transcriptional regulator [unclassified Arthrobacter]MCC9196072.1 TetR/AcrR family transcriptional regulator [Arthrobacter sp. zg-Y820]MDK1278931.1 TetR/AcrR family transcriptional regulator [Arthrobacter sp. zg.Y820]WIB08655.1 TetR/AcrR family transcriptional regulator [Arthrobacter sp. zg-Y820]
MKTMNIKEELARVSVELFSSQGYAKTSVQQIVDAAGVTKGALYHYFNSKDDLLFDIYDRILTLQHRNLDEIIARGLPVEQTVRLVCEDVIVTSIEWIREGSVFFRSQHMLSPDRMEAVKIRRRQYGEVFGSLITRGREEGTFRNDIPTAVLVANFFANPHYLSFWYQPSGALSKHQVAKQLTDLYLAGLRPAPPEGSVE